MADKKYFPLPKINPEFINKHSYFMLFETSLFNRQNYRSFIFSAPHDIIKVHKIGEIEAAFKKIEAYSRRYYIAGYFAYELGYYFERSIFRPQERSESPLIHLAIFDKPAEFDHISGKLKGKTLGLFCNKQDMQAFSISNISFSLSKAGYARNIAKIREYIRKGDTYQVNFTGKYNFNFHGDLLSAYNDLKNRQNVSYSAFCKLGKEFIISLSPELFFRREKDTIFSLPMKGTLRRGRVISEDGKNARLLQVSPKNRAENLMVVDLIRNDLGRICRPGSIKVMKLFDVEKYSTLFQMTSLVKGKLRERISYFDIFKTLFPGGSVTGAPKIRTMEIIRMLEKLPRNVYCGALGFISPENKAVFNMPIRTLHISKGKGEMGVGSGIVIDSSANDEYFECLLKARFLTSRYKEFKLIETILWDKGYFLLPGHLKRLQYSAQYFSFLFPEDIISKLKEYSRRFNSKNKYRLRLLLSKDGKVEISSIALKGRPLITARAAFSKYKIDQEDIFLYHKTTNRSLYDSEYRRIKNKGFFDVIFQNKRGEITEGAISNIIILKNGIFYTPPVNSGLLPGVYREYLIKSRRARERKLSVKDLYSADKVFLCNSVRGLVEASLPSC